MLFVRKVVLIELPAFRKALIMTGRPPRPAIYQTLKTLPPKYLILHPTLLGRSVFCSSENVFSLMLGHIDDPASRHFTRIISDLRSAAQTDSLHDLQTVYYGIAKINLDT